MKKKPVNSEQKDVTTSFRLTETTYTEAQQKAKQEGFKLSKIIRGLINNWLRGEIPTPKIKENRSDKNKPRRHYRKR